jgi:hypothetical protein
MRIPLRNIESLRKTGRRAHPPKIDNDIIKSQRHIVAGRLTQLRKQGNKMIKAGEKLAVTGKSCQVTNDSDLIPVLKSFRIRYKRYRREEGLRLVAESQVSATRKSSDMIESAVAFDMK